MPAGIITKHCWLQKLPEKASTRPPLFALIMRWMRQNTFRFGLTSHAAYVEMIEHSHLVLSDAESCK
jgi:hypothetical protein